MEEQKTRERKKWSALLKTHDAHIHTCARAGKKKSRERRKGTENNHYVATTLVDLFFFFFSEQ